MRISDEKLRYTFLRFCHCLGVKAYLPCEDLFLYFNRYWVGLIRNGNLSDSISREKGKDIWQLVRTYDSFCLIIAEDNHASYSLTNQKRSEIFRSMEFTIKALEASKEGCKFMISIDEMKLFTRGEHE